MVGLLTERLQIPALTRDLAAAGVDVSAVEILCGEQGARILDAHGRYHGLRARIGALLQRHQAHDVGYFGSGTFEQFPILDTD